LPATERAKGPARIIGAFGKQVEQQIAFENTLRSYAAQGGPEIDTSKTAQFINTDHRIGNTGASTFFMQMAVGVMGSYYEGGTSAAVNLRDPAGASIVFISRHRPKGARPRRAGTCSSTRSSRRSTLKTTSHPQSALSCRLVVKWATGKKARRSSKV
jgi:hypothetical protein